MSHWLGTAGTAATGAHALASPAEGTLCRSMMAVDVLAVQTPVLA